ncbi:MAG: hypothetical protein IPH88_18440 [Bacteroidales bacterium]|nr:hypothetical protein [Bacteroidales bacterium]
MSNLITVTNMKIFREDYREPPIGKLLEYHNLERPQGNRHQGRVAD